jgi:hypothetical protein
MEEMRDNIILFQRGALRVEVKEVGIVLEMDSRNSFSLSEGIMSTKKANKILKNPHAE